MHRMGKGEVKDWRIVGLGSDTWDTGRQMPGHTFHSDSGLSSHDPSAPLRKMLILWSAEHVATGS